MPDIDEEANRLPENMLQRQESDGILLNDNNHNPSRLSAISRKWDTEHKGYLTTSQRHARAADKDGKGYLSAEEARSMGSQIAALTDQYQRIHRNLRRVLCLLVILCGATIAATYFAITGNQEETMVDENGALLAANGGTQVSVKSLGLKIFTYTMPSTSNASGSKVCLSADDLALAWTENENGGVATFVIESVGGEQVLRLGASNARMTEEKVTFGDLELFPDPECTILSDTDTTTSENVESTSEGRSSTTTTPTTTADDSNRRLRENVQALREGRDIHRQLRMVAFSFSDGDLC
eukprot:CAMPEP_0113660608 /NCGR_PEP_ID=MMETSP0017_2-20120614/32992_1 /TAXON_ID=2856 /ORGANISM="Cylindrotheca closterium" /LENGTH=295 /DNA_ID=CAMNT_0000575257 /DNA_START=39 /DNA_END=926 /DNA_ORIENTATION=+ /assembly_acc=CAM_ASM_000147